VVRVIAFPNAMFSIFPQEPSGMLPVFIATPVVDFSVAPLFLLSAGFIPVRDELQSVFPK